MTPAIHAAIGLAAHRRGIHLRSRVGAVDLSAFGLGSPGGGGGGGLPGVNMSNLGGSGPGGAITQDDKDTAIELAQQEKTAAQNNINGVDALISSQRAAIAAIGVDENGNATDPSMQPVVDAQMGTLNSLLSQRAGMQAQLDKANADLAAANALVVGVPPPGFQAPPSQPQPGPSPAPPAPSPVTPPPTVAPVPKKTAWWKWALGGAAAIAGVVAVDPKILHHKR